MASSLVQVKLFYNIGFKDDKCQAIFFTNENLPHSYCQLLDRSRDKIEALGFIPDSELRVQYYDDEGTLVHLRENDYLQEVWRCAKNVEGTEFRRVKIRITWQPQTTPEMLLSKRRELAQKTGETDNKFGNVSQSTASKRKLDYDENNPLDLTAKDACTPPPSKQQLHYTSTTTKSTASNLPTDQYSSPLELLLQDKQMEIVELQQQVVQTERDYEQLSDLYGQKSDIDYTKPACTNCHRREGHNRANCPYRGHACLSAKFCGDLNKHKNEKDIVSEKLNLLQTQRRTLAKMKNMLAAKQALKNQVTSSFSSSIRSRLIKECPQRYTNSFGFENWRQVNVDLKKLEAHFKGKIPPVDVSLIEALQIYESKLSQPSTSSRSATGNPLRTLWELKGMKWPSSNQDTN